MSNEDFRPQQRPTAPPSTGYGRPTEGLAIGALICAVLSWIALPVIMAIVALVLASIARQKIADSRGAYGGEGLITAASIIAWINLALAGLVLLFIIAGVILLIVL